MVYAPTFGDVFMAAQLVWKVRDSFTRARGKAPPPFIQIEGELRALQVILNKLGVAMSLEDAVLAKINDETKSYIAELVQTCEQTSKHLQRLVARFSSPDPEDDSRHWHRLFIKHYSQAKWTPEGGNIEAARRRLHQHNVAAAETLMAVQGTSLGKFQSSMKDIVERSRIIFEELNGDQSLKVEEINISGLISETSPAITSKTIPRTSSFESQRATVKPNRPSSSRSNGSDESIRKGVVRHEESEERLKPHPIPIPTDTPDLTDGEFSPSPRRSSISSYGKVHYYGGSPSLTPAKLPSLHTGRRRVGSPAPTSPSIRELNEEGEADWTSLAGKVSSPTEEHGFSLGSPAIEIPPSEKFGNGGSVFANEDPWRNDAISINTQSTVRPAPSVEDPVATTPPQIEVIQRRPTLTPPDVPVDRVAISKTFKTHETWDPITIQEHKKFMRDLMNTGTCLLELDVYRVDYTQQTEEDDGQMVVKEACLDGKMYYVQREVRTESGKIRFLRSIWVVSNDRRVRIQQQIPENEIVTPYTVWDRDCNVVLRYPTVVRYHSAALDEGPMLKDCTSWVKYHFDSAREANSLQDAILEQHIMLSVATKSTKAKFDGIANALRFEMQMCKLENIRIIADPKTGLVTALTYLTPTFGRGYLAFAINSNLEPIKIEDIKGENKVQIKGISIADPGRKPNVAGAGSRRASATSAAELQPAPAPPSRKGSFSSPRLGARRADSTASERHASICENDIVVGRVEEPAEAADGGRSASPGKKGAARAQKMITKAVIEFSRPEDKIQFMTTVQNVRMRPLVSIKVKQY